MKEAIRSLIAGDDKFFRGQRMVNLLQVETAAYQVLEKMGDNVSQLYCGKVIGNQFVYLLLRMFTKILNGQQ